MFVIMLLVVAVFSVSCDSTGKEVDNGYKNEPPIDSEEIPPESNNYQGLRFETARLESSIIEESFPRLVCLGDSVTFGWNIPYEKSYPFLLGKKLREQYPEALVINSGIGGQTVVDGPDRLESDVLYYNPQLVIINFGLNDAFIIIEKDSQEQVKSTSSQTEREVDSFEPDGSLIDEETDLKNNVDLDTFIDTYGQLVSEILEKDIEIIIMSTNPAMTELLWENEYIAQKQEESYMLYNQTARGIAYDYGLIFVDIWEGFINEGELDTLIQPDGLHPNEAGLILISEILSTSLESLDLTERK